MYDVDGNGVIDIQEMTKIVQVILSYYAYTEKDIYFVCGLKFVIIFTHRISFSIFEMNFIG